MRRINAICNPTSYQVPPEAEDMSDVTDDKLRLIDRALQAINNRLSDADISV